MYPKRTEAESYTLQLMGEDIKQTRLALGISLVAVASQTRLDDANYFRIEKGETKPCPRNLCKIADYLGIPRSYILECGGYMSFSPELSEEERTGLKKAINKGFIELE